jgi:paraquat-inducible protein B
MHSVTVERHRPNELRCSRPTADTLLVELSGTWRTFVAYFEGSVKGLNVGAPVEFQGVKVGSVTDISLQFLTAENEFRIPVFIEIEPGRMTQVGRQIDLHGQLFKPLIERGLREFSGAARSFRLLADYLERNPDSLVYGKGGNRR